VALLFQLARRHCGRDVGINFLLNEYKAMSAANLYRLRKSALFTKATDVIPRKSDALSRLQFFK
jgi:hypothetical protein